MTFSQYRKGLPRFHSDSFHALRRDLTDSRFHDYRSSGRSVPHCQHVVNWGPCSSPHLGHFHDLPQDEPSPLTYLDAIDSASSRRLSSRIHTEGWPSTVACPCRRDSFRIIDPMPWASSSAFTQYASPNEHDVKTFFIHISSKIRSRVAAEKDRHTRRRPHLHPLASAGFTRACPRIPSSPGCG